MFILCLDHSVEEPPFSKIDNLILIPLHSLESFYPSLRKIRSTRKWESYVGTVKPFFLRYLLEFYAADQVAMVDSDMLFLGPVSEIEVAMAATGLMVISREIDPPSKSGYFNDGFVAASAAGLSFLEWWCSRCADWCEWMEIGPDGAFQAEGYLNILHDDPDRFPDAKWIKNPGINLAPWNAQWHHLSSTADGILVDGVHPLICYHYRGFQDHSKPFLEDVTIGKEYVDLLHRPYYRLLCKAADEFQERRPGNAG